MKVLLLFLTFITINIYGQKKSYDQKIIYKTKFDDAIPVLNVGTFHMGETSDEQSTEFDELDKKNQLEIKKLAKLLAEFKPTIIVIEDVPKNDSLRQFSYSEYIKNPKKKFQKPDERELLAYEVGRLSGAKKIYGIDFKESYNYNISVKNIRTTEAPQYKKFTNNKSSYYL